GRQGPGRAGAAGDGQEPHARVCGARSRARARDPVAPVPRRCARAFAPGDERLAPLARLTLAKICNAASDPVPDGVERLLASGSDDVGAFEQWALLLREPLLVVGGTPG